MRLSTAILGIFIVGILPDQVIVAQEDNADEKKAKGVLIEYERSDSDQANPDASKGKKRVSQNKEVQLILGGQSEDGVVKRTKLKVQD